MVHSVNSSATSVFRTNQRGVIMSRGSVTVYLAGTVGNVVSRYLPYLHKL